MTLETPQTHFVVASRAMTDLVAMAESAAKSPATVLITGESGVGKDLVARYVHSQSSRRLASFVGMTCAGLTEARLESQLFEHARGGTLFLDEVGDLSLRMQAWLLRFLENGEIQAVGPDRPVPQVDVRVVAATNRHLNDLAAAGQFREDLLYRLRVIHLHVPPLRERAEDVDALMRHFLARSGRELNFTDSALLAFRRYSWPGNVRELRNVVEQLVWLSAAGVAGVEHLPLSIRTAHAVLTPVGDHRRQTADELYDALVTQGASFWEHVYPMFLARDITRHDLRELVRLGLRQSRGRYKSMLELFGMSSGDYRRFMNFLAAHGCGVGVREFRGGRSTSQAESEAPPLYSATTELPQDCPAGSDSHVQ
jgi:DNA-binding NtrC family response regulator